MNKFLRASTIALAAVVATTLTPMLASATTHLGADEAVWLSDWDGDASLYSLDVNTQPFETIKWGTAADTISVFAADVDPTTGKFYYLSAAQSPDGTYGTLTEVDPETGAVVDSFDILFNDETVVAAYGFAIDAEGRALMTFSDGPDSHFGTVDLDTGEILTSFPLEGVNAEDFEWVASDMESDAVYVGDELGSVYRVNEDLEEIDEPVTIPTGGGTTFSADFDAAGTLWYSVWGDDGTEVWKSSTPGEGELVTLIPQVDGPSDVTYNAIFIGPKPELAETGTDEATVPALLTLGAAFVAGGVALRRRLVRR